jgi:hypothetical protein
MKGGIDGVRRAAYRRRRAGARSTWRIGLVAVAVMILVVMLAAAGTAVAAPAHELSLSTLQAPVLGHVHGLKAQAPTVAARTGQVQRRSSSEVELFYDGFETDPVPWGALGDPTWGLTTYRAAAGGWSAYCAGSAVDPPGPYFNNMEARLYTGPIDMSGVTSATLAFQMYLDCVSGFDGLVPEVTIDGGASWYDVDPGWTGSTGGWVPVTLDLTNIPGLGNVCGQSEVYIAFRFDSDGADVAEGAYVDEVSITGEEEPTSVVMTMEASATKVPYMGSVDLVGLLSDEAGTPIPGVTAQFAYSYSNGAENWWNLGDPQYSSDGYYGLSLIQIDRRTFVAFYVPGTTLWSNTVKVMAKAKVRAPLTGTTIQHGVKVTKWGTLWPQHSVTQNTVRHMTTYVYRWQNGRWVLKNDIVAKRYINNAAGTTTKFEMQCVFYQTGRYAICSVHKDANHLRTASPFRYFKVI